ncbi:MAG TPA: PTS sugar transporter subunit IIA [Candidatus Kapabacteria bacterium]|nr:PTS sugar transporter subunit IIA [Candidatus Kapabacteria bacterium]HPO63319.1 PTS sugar transporter subunit IIA [Candidatus Kapabacteria bacterium]
MKITEIINKDNIELLPNISSKTVLVDKLIEIAARTGKIINIEEVKKQVWDREKLMSTGVGKGIALPHAKTNHISDETGALIVLKQGVEFESLDDKPVNIAFLLIGKDNNVGNHLRLLSKISRLLNNEYLRSNIIEAKTKNEILSLFDEFEESE